jgi:DUF917 family protein
MHIDRSMLDDFARGAAFLGSGGGGDPYYSSLLAEAAIEKHGNVELVPLDSLPDDALVAPCGWIGAPTVSIEKLPNGGETTAGLQRLEQVIGRRIDAVFPIEIGGGNGLAPIIAAAKLGLPIVDCDGMGRAFPESQMAIFNIRGLPSCPSVLTAACGALSVMETGDNLTHERMARALSVALGGIAHMVEYPMSGAQAKANAIGGSITAAIAIGAAVSQTRASREDPFEALYRAVRQTGLYAHCGALFDGKIVDLERQTRDGFSIGTVTIEGAASQGRMQIQFQNENLVARHGDVVRATVPDLITIMDRETADAITTERLKFGQRVRVVGAAAPKMLRDASALTFVGPSAFGLGAAFQPIEALNAWENS